MKRILIGLLLVTLVTFYIVQKKQIQDYLASILPRDRLMEQAIPQVKRLQQDVELLAYPPPPDEPLPPYPPPDNSPTRTPFPSPTPRPTPTLAPYTLP